MIDTIIQWIPLLTLLAYLPFICYLDWKLQWIEHEYWLPLVLVNVPIITYAYATGMYPLELLGLSLAFVILWFALMKLNWYNGADFVFLMMITLFFVFNPISGRVLMPLVLAEMLICATVISGIVVLAARKKIERFPYILTISVAFLLTVVLG